MRSTQKRILDLLEKKKRCKPSNMAAVLGISRQALHRQLRILLEAQHIVKHGSGSHVYYTLTSQQYNSRMQNDYELCNATLLPHYTNLFAKKLGRIEKNLQENVQHVEKARFGYMLESSAVYSSNIEGNTLNLSSFLNSRMAPKKHQPREAAEIEDLISAYQFAQSHALTEKNMLKAHAVLSTQFVNPSRQGVYRQEPVGVFSRFGLEYMAVESDCVAQEMQELFRIVRLLLKECSRVDECFFWASWIHLMIALIHPFSDGNGRTARLCEKWFLGKTLGPHLFLLQSEEQYWNRRSEYYSALKLGPNYWETDIEKALLFFLLLPEGIQNDVPD